MNDMSKMCQKWAVKNTRAVFGQDNQDVKKVLKAVSAMQFVITMKTKSKR